MQKFRFLMMLAAFVATVVFTGCEDTKDDVVTPTTTQGVVITSTPAGAEIVYNAKVLGVTPLKIDTLKAGTSYAFTLKLANCSDNSFTYTAVASKIDTVTKPMLGILVNMTTVVKVWESSDTSSAHPSGIALRLGKALSYATANKDSLDMYYFSKRSAPVAYELRSLPTSFSSRTAYFKKGASLLTDGVDATAKDATWISAYSDQASEYYFVYDSDKHYSKIKITSRGGLGTTGNEAWVEVQWIYNKAVDNIYF